MLESVAMNDAETQDQIAKRMYRNDRVHTALPSPDALDDEQVRRFAELGFIAVENVFTTREMESAKQALSAIIASPAAEKMCLDIEPAARNRKLAAPERDLITRV